MSNRSNTELWTSRLIWTAVVTNLPHIEKNRQWYRHSCLRWAVSHTRCDTSSVRFERVKGWLDEMTQPEAFFIAKHAQRYVAFSSVFSIGTAVHPKYRRKGIVTQLKAGSIADAQRRGFRGQTTSTASPAMQVVLERLGYKRLWSEIRLIRTMDVK